MKSKYKIGVSVFLSLAACLLGAYYLSTVDMAVMNPKGIVGVREKDLLVISTWLMLIVVIPVFLLTFFIIWRYRASNKNAKYTPDWDHSYWAEAIWWGLPTLIIIVLSVLTWIGSHDLDPFKPLESDKKPLVIQVVALQWKWLFIYPEQGIATVNYVQFPDMTPIRFVITADAPMNAFWIPKLGGMIFAMSGMKTELQLMSHEEGSFRGSSANISGKGFAGMEFVAKATSEEAFENWAAQVKASSSGLGAAEYKILALPSERNPVTTYTLEQDDLFDQIVMKYMMPMPPTDGK